MVCWRSNVLVVLEYKILIPSTSQDHILTMAMLGQREKITKDMSWSFLQGNQYLPTKEPPTEGMWYKINLKPLKLHRVLFICLLFAANSTCRWHSIFLVLTFFRFMDCLLILLPICAVHERDRTKLAPPWPFAVPGNEGMRAPAMRVSQHCSFGHWTPLMLPYTGRNSLQPREYASFFVATEYSAQREYFREHFICCISDSRKIRRWI